MDRDDVMGLKVELTSENDLFFYYMHRVDRDGFHYMQQSQKLLIELNEYPAILTRLLTACIKEPHEFLAVFIMRRDGKARLDFIQNMEYKFVELLCVDFVAGAEEDVRRNISFRYNAAKSKLDLTTGRIHDISSILKIKNPSLLAQLHARNATKSRQG